MEEFSTLTKISLLSSNPTATSSSPMTPCSPDVVRITLDLPLLFRRLHDGVRGHWRG
jgi:hypothetical protein